MKDLKQISENYFREPKESSTLMFWPPVYTVSLLTDTFPLSVDEKSTNKSVNRHLLHTQVCSKYRTLF